MELAGGPARVKPLRGRDEHKWGREGAWPVGVRLCRGGKERVGRGQTGLSQTGTAWRVPSALAPCALPPVFGDVFGDPRWAFPPCLTSPQSLGLAEVETEAVPPRSEESSKEEEPQSKQQETLVKLSRLPGEPEQGSPPLMVQLSLLRAETDR